MSENERHFIRDDEYYRTWIDRVEGSMYKHLGFALLYIILSAFMLSLLVYNLDHYNPKDDLLWIISFVISIAPIFFSIHSLKDVIKKYIELKKIDKEWEEELENKEV